MAATRWVMVDLSDSQIIHTGVCMYEHLEQVPLADNHAVIVSPIGDAGQYWNGIGPQDDPIPPP